jgi:hypothetical protein
MVKQSGTHRSIGRTWALAAIAVLAAGSALALGNDGPSRGQTRLIEMRIMNVYGVNYGATNWSAVTRELAAHPGDAGNTAVMSIPLSLGNVYLNRYETGQDPADLQRAIQMFERVTSNYAWWGARAGSGSIATYLDLSLSRLRAECDVGTADGEINSLWEAARAITAEEADAALGVEVVEAAAPFAATFDPSPISVLVTAASLLGEDSRAAGWELAAEKIASSYQSSCLTLETYIALSQGTLSYEIAKRKVPSGLTALFSLAVFRTGLGCGPVVTGYQTSGLVAAVEEGESLRMAVHDSQVAAFFLDRLLSQFPPGSQCGSGQDDPDRVPIDISR